MNGAIQHLFPLRAGAGSAAEMGFKGYNLARMARLGLPVPDGFVLGTALCREWLKDPEAAQGAARSMIESALRDLERASGLRFGDARRPLLGYAALVLEHIIRRAKPREIVVSAVGVREGLLYSLLNKTEQMRDPLLAAARDLNVLRSRSPQHGEELIEWTDRFMASSGIDETAEEVRLRHAACLLADIGWRAHPDYRGEQSLNIIAHASFLGVDHPGRAFLALAVFFRHVGLWEGELSPHVRELASARMIDRARVLGGALRVAYLISAAMPGVLPEMPLAVVRGQLILPLKGRHIALGGERLYNRLRQLGRLIGREVISISS